MSETMLMNFDTDLDQPGVTQITTAVEVEESVKIKHKPSVSREYLGKAVWGWRDLRDYVVYEIQERHGAFPRDQRKEYGIFTSFVNRWGAEDAQAIARYAFEMLDGRWAGAPISIYRFCKGSDDFFARPILDYIEDAR